MRPYRPVFPRPPRPGNPGTPVAPRVGRTRQRPRAETGRHGDTTPQESIMSTHKKGPNGVLKVPKQKKALSPYGRHVVTCMTGSTKVPNPNPPLPAITKACEALDISQAAMPGNKATTAQRDADWLALLLLLHHELDYVNSA